MVESFRPRRIFRFFWFLIAAVCRAIFVLVLIAVFLDRPAGRSIQNHESQVLGGALAAGFFGSIILVTAVGLAASFAQRFEIDGQTFSIRTLLGNRRFDASGLETLIWKVTHGGSIVFEAQGVKSRLDLFEFSDKDRLRIITAARDLVPTTVQMGWPDFCQKVALPLRDRATSRAESRPNSEKITITRILRVYAVEISIWLLIAAPFWFWTKKSWSIHELLLGGLVAWLICRFENFRDERAEPRAPSTERAVSRVILGAFVVLIVIFEVGASNWIGWASIALLMGVAGPTAARLFFTAYRESRSRYEKAVEAAPRLWMQGPTGVGESGRGT